MTKIGYARTSTVDQKAGLVAQVRDLVAAGCAERDIHVEQVSAKSLDARVKLDLVLNHILRPGDVLVATKIDRLARSIRDLVGIIDRVHGAGAHLNVLSLGSTDPATPMGKLLVTILGAIAEFEREIMLERQAEGIAKAKAEGKYVGRQPTARKRAAEVQALKAEGVGPAEIARRLKIGRASVYRILSAG